MAEKLDKYMLKNGMVILGERMKHVGSVAFIFRLPCGSSTLPDGSCGAGEVISDWIFRGAGKMDSKALIDALDGLGLHRAGSISSAHLSLGAALEASNLEKALRLYADIILQPKLDDQQFEFSRELAVQDLIGLDDDPRQKVMLDLREQFYPQPLGLPSEGKIDDLKALNAARVAEIIKKKFNLSNAVFAIAGKYDFQAVCSQLEEIFESPQPAFDSKITIGPRGSKYTHHQHEGAQVHIGVMTDTVAIASDDYYNAMAAVSILSGGMSSRLFTEVREKRGLCYAIGARYNTLKDYAGIACYAGTTPDKAQETLDVIIAEFNALCEGITEDEIQRAKVGLKSTLIMQSEVTSSRAGGIASDHYLLGRVRTLDEIKDKLESISAGSVEAFLNSNKFDDYTVVTIGPNKVNI